MGDRTALENITRESAIHEVSVRMMNEKQAARMLGVSIAALRRWRREGRGPRFARLEKCVRYAHPHSMKSLSWLAATIEAVAKNKVWGHFDAPGVNSSLFIESEDPNWLLEERICGIAKGMGLKAKEDAQGFHYLRTGPFDLVKLERSLKDILNFYRPDFAVLSTLQSLLSDRDWNEQGDMQAVNSVVVRLASICPLVVITHSPWDKRARRAAGSVTQAANFLTTMHFEKVQDPKSTDSFIHVRVDSKIGAEQTDFHLKLETEGGDIRGLIYNGPGWPKGGGKRAILAAIEEDPDATPKEIADRIGVTPRYVQKLVKEHSQAGSRTGER